MIDESQLTSWELYLRSVEHLSPEELFAEIYREHTIGQVVENEIERWDGFMYAFIEIQSKEGWTDPPRSPAYWRYRRLWERAGRPSMSQVNGIVEFLSATKNAPSVN